MSFNPRQPKRQLNVPVKLETYKQIEPLLGENSLYVLLHVEKYVIWLRGQHSMITLEALNCIAA